jgi:uncharacterized alpha-E superfamily protein
MLSRIADALFWLNRYMERADGLLRTVSTHYILSLDKGISSSASWRPVLETFTTCDAAEIAQLESNTEAALKKLITDTSNSNSLKVLVIKARENARGVQDHITKEVWEEVNQLYHLVNQPFLNSRLNGQGAMEVLELFTRHSVLYTGITDMTMSRGLGWCFMNLGKYLERCFETILLTDKQFEQLQYNLQHPRDIMQWRFLLLSLSGYELHLKTYRSGNYNQNVLRQVFINPTFTRSVVYSLGRIDRYLREVTQGSSSAANAGLLSCFGRLYSKVLYVDFDSLNNATLQQFLLELNKELTDFSRRFVQNFFSYS